MAPTFVLLHGGAQGGWCYRWLAPVLRQRGYEAYAPTLTGFGDRAHLATEPTIEDHVLDVANLLEYEDLHDVVLVGHSMGGVVVPLVAERARERVARVVWLAGIVLGDGESIATHYAMPSEAVRRAAAPGPDGTRDPGLLIEVFMQDGTDRQKEWLQARLGPMAMAPITHVGDLTRFLALGVPTGYVVALRDQSLPPALARAFAARLPGARLAEVDAGHNLMITRPEETADALEAVVA